jgi:cytosine/uracil/thiamine/allantoin permease
MDTYTIFEKFEEEIKKWKDNSLEAVWVTEVILVTVWVMVAMAVILVTVWVMVVMAVILVTVWVMVVMAVIVDSITDTVVNQLTGALIE